MKVYKIEDIGEIMGISLDKESWYGKDCNFVYSPQHYRIPRKKKKYLKNLAKYHQKISKN